LAEKGVNEVAPLLLSDNGDLGNIFLARSHKVMSPQSLSRFQPRKFSRMNSANFAATLNHFESGRLDLTDFNLAKFAADLDGDDGFERIKECKWHVAYQ
jgi:hypothetical protein